MRVPLAILVVVVVGSTGICLAQTCGAPVHDWPAGASHVVFTDGDRFFYGLGSALVAAQAEETTTLETIDHLRPTRWPLVDAAVNENLAVVADWTGVTVLALDQPGLPSAVGRTGIRGGIYAVRSAGSLAAAYWWDSDFMSYYIEGIEVIDLAEPSQPAVVGTIDLSPYAGATGTIQMIPDGLYYLVDEHLEFYDLSDPANPVLAAESDRPGWRSLLAIDRNTMVVDAGDALLFVDLSDPAAPEVEHAYQPWARVEHALWSGDVLLLVAGDGFEIVDVGAAEPHRISLTPGVFPDGVRDLAATPNNCLVIEGDDWRQTLRVIDVSDPATPIFGDAIVRPSEVVDLAVEPARIAALTDRALWLVDHEPDGELTERLAFQSGGDNIGIHDDLAFIGDSQWSHSAPHGFVGWYRLRILDLSIGDEAELIAEIDLDSPAGGTIWDSFQLVGDDWVAVALDQGPASRVEVVDVRDPTRPTTGRAVPLENGVDSATSTGDLILTIARRRLDIVDVGDPLSSWRVGGLEFDDYIWEIAAWGRYAYVIGNTELMVVDVAEPDRPTVVGRTDYDGYASAVDTTPGFLVIHEGDLVQIFDVRDPTSPVLVETIDELPCSKSHFFLSSLVSGDLLVSGGDRCGVQTLDLASCTQAPGNPAANFTISPPFPIAGNVVGFEDRSSGDPFAWSWSFGDGSTSALENPTHVYDEPGTYTVNLTVSNAIGSSSSTLDLGVSGAGGLPVADFDWARLTSVRDPVIFVDESLGRPTSWYWSFGDGYTSIDPNPSHFYALPGEYEVTLEIGNAAGTSTATKTVVVPLNVFTSGMGPWVRIDELFGAVASSPGRRDTRWRSDLTLFNTTDVTQGFYLHYLPRGDQNNGEEAPQTWVNLNPRQTVIVENVVGDLFGLDETAGALLTERPSHASTFSRTFTTDPEGGSYGQAVPGLEMASVNEDVVSQVLIGLRNDPGFRSNIGLVKLTQWASSRFWVRAYSSAGELAGERLVEMGPYAFLQIDNALAEIAGPDLERGYVVIGKSPDSIQGYTSTIDNHTGDAVFLPAQPVSVDLSPETWIVPAVASVNGAEGTRWRSHLELLNPTTEVSIVQLTLIGNVDGPETPSPREVNVQPGEFVIIEDVVGEFFNTSGVGALVIESTTPLHPTSRTFTGGTDGGTFGQHIPALPLSGLLAENTSASLPGLREDEDFRTNLGLVNPSSEPAVVEITSLDFLGEQHTSKTITLEPGEHRQLNRILQLVGGIDRATLTLTVEEGSVAAYASVVDNSTGDPVFMSALEHP